MAAPAAVDRELRGVRREQHCRGFLYLVRDRFTGTTFVAQRLRLATVTTSQRFSDFTPL